MGSADWSAIAGGLNKARDIRQQEYDRQQKAIMDELQRNYLRAQTEGVKNENVIQTPAVEYAKTPEAFNAYRRLQMAGLNSAEAQAVIAQGEAAVAEKLNQLKVDEKELDIEEKQDNIRFNKGKLEYSPEYWKNYFKGFGYDTKLKGYDVDKAAAESEYYARDAKSRSDNLLLNNLLLQQDVDKKEAERPQWETWAELETEIKRQQLQKEIQAVKKGDVELEYYPEQMELTVNNLRQNNDLLKEQVLEAQLTNQYLPQKLQKELSKLDKELEELEIAIREKQAIYEARQKHGWHSEAVRLELITLQREAELKQLDIKKAIEDVQQSKVRGQYLGQLLQLELDQGRANIDFTRKQISEWGKGSSGGGGGGGSSGGGKGGSSGYPTSKWVNEAEASYKRIVKSNNVAVHPTYSSPKNASVMKERWDSSRKNPNAVISEVLKRKGGGSLAALWVQPPEFWSGQGYDYNAISGALYNRVLSYMKEQIKAVKGNAAAKWDKYTLTLLPRYPGFKATPEQLGLPPRR